jgi:hypothetical protein
MTDEDKNMIARIAHKIRAESDQAFLYVPGDTVGTYEWDATDYRAISEAGLFLKKERNHGLYTI